MPRSGDPPQVGCTPPSRRLRAGWLVAALGVPAAVLAGALDPAGARASAAQVWPPFVLVAGLLLVGLVADDDGLFAAVGDRLALVVPNEAALFVAIALLVSAVTAVLNLDTSVAFLTPVLVYLARARRSDEAPYLYGCLLLSNAASLLLPGSNLTNLIVLGHLHLSGARFAAHMAPAFAASVAVTALVVGLAHRGGLRRGSVEARARRRAPEHGPEVRPRAGLLGALCVVGATALVVLLHSPAPWVAALGAGAIAFRLLQRRDRVGHVLDVLGIETLVGLLGIAVALGTAGRSWSGPSWLLAHLDPWATAAVGAVAAVLTNNLPGASLLAARVPPHPYSLLVGLNLGPNLFVTGSLSWLLWLQSARRAGARPAIAHAGRLGAVVVPVSIVAAMAALVASGRH